LELLDVFFESDKKGMADQNRVPKWAQLQPWEKRGKTPTFDEFGAAQKFVPEQKVYFPKENSVLIVNFY